MHIREDTVANLKPFDIGSKFSFLPELPRASVLIPLFVKKGELYTLMTLRSKEVLSNSRNLSDIYPTPLVTDW